MRKFVAMVVLTVMLAGPGVLQAQEPGRPGVGNKSIACKAIERIWTGTGPVPEILATVLGCSLK